MASCDPPRDDHVDDHRFHFRSGNGDGVHEYEGSAMGKRLVSCPVRPVGVAGAVVGLVGSRRVGWVWIGCGLVGG